MSHLKPPFRPGTAGRCSCSVLRPLRMLAAMPAVAVVSALVVSSASGDGLRLQGTTDYLFYDWAGQRVLTKHHARFSLDLDRSGTWLLTVTSTLNTNGYFVDAFDGTNHFTIRYTTRLSQSAGSAELTAPIPIERGNHVADVSVGPYPLDLFPPERMIWFALASGPYLQSLESRQMPAPWRNPRLGLLAYSFTNTVEQHPGWPRAPVRAEFVTRGPREPSELADLLVPSGKTFLASREREEKKVRALEPGQFAARYSVGAFTNVFQAQIPLQYRLEVFWPGFGVNTTNRTVAEFFSGEVTNISRIHARVSRPDILGTMSVNDYRFHYQDSTHALNQLRYRITNHVWKEMADPSLQAGFRSLKATVRRYDHPWSRRIKRATLIVLIGGVVLLPLVLMRMKRQ